MNRIPKKNENALKQMIWIPLVRVWMFGAAVLSYLRDNSFVRISMSTIFFVISFMISATGYRFGKVYLFLLIFSIPAAVVLTMISMLCRFGVEGTRAEIKSIYDDFHSRMWNYENISGSEGNRYQHLVIENEPDNIAYRIAGYLASLGGGIDTDCINSLNSIISSDNPNKQALYRKCFYEGVSSRYNFENDISMFKMKAADMYDEKIKLLDMLVALSYVDGNISVEKFKFIREVSSKIEINNKVLNRILSTRTNGQYGVHYDMDEMTREEQGKPDYVERINNRYTRDELEEAQGNVPVLDVLEKAIGYPQTDDYLLFQPEWLAKLNELYTEENLVKIRDSMIVKAAISSAGSLDRECYEWSVECSNAISGSNGMLPDETVFSSKVANALPWPVSRLYTEKYLSQEDKDRISGMIDEIIEEYHGIIEEADFLSDETKEAAAGKLDAMGKGVLWPDDWSAYDSEGLEIASAEDGGTAYYVNVRKGSAHKLTECGKSRAGSVRCVVEE